MHEVKTCSGDRLGIDCPKLFAEMPFHLWIYGVLILMLKIKMKKFVYQWV